MCSLGVQIVTVSTIAVELVAPTAVSSHSIDKFGSFILHFKLLLWLYFVNIKESVDISYGPISRF